MVIVLLCLPTQTVQAASNHTSSLISGKYIFFAAGCAGCHTDIKNKGALLAGGRAIKTPFGTFYGPNITPDKTFGIGAWSEKDFIRALRRGVSPDGEHYFPVFPYTSFTKMNDSDILNLRAYIFSLPSIAKPNIPHELNFPYNIREFVYFWKFLFFDKGSFQPNAEQTEEWNRGAYITEALAHCGECHTPRNFLGAQIRDKALAGTNNGPEGNSIPNITPDLDSGIGNWSLTELVELLKFGMLPDGDFVGGSMSEVSVNMANLTEADLLAIAKYVSSIPAIKNKVTVK